MLEALTPAQRLRQARREAEEKAAHAGSARSVPLTAPASAEGHDVDGAGSAQSGIAVAGREPRAWEASRLHILHASGYLPIGSQPTLVRDDEDHVWIDIAWDPAVEGRHRVGLDEIISLGEMGDCIVQAMFKRGATQLPASWVSYAFAARVLARAIRGLELTSTPPGDLPTDLFARVEAWLSAKGGGVRLKDSARALLNKARWLVGAAPACGHVDVTPDRVGTSYKTHWSMQDDQPVPHAEVHWGDVETERLLKRCSAEAHATVASWNQFVSFLAGADVGGPLDLREKLIARSLLTRNAVVPVNWWEIVEDEGVEKALFELGCETVADARARAEDGEPLQRFMAQRIGTLRKLEASGLNDPGAHVIRLGREGIMMAAWERAVAVAYPTIARMTPFIVLLDIMTRLNGTPLAGMRIDDFDEVDGDEAGGERRMQAAPFKGRSHRLYPVDLPVTLRADEPAPIVAFLKKWTRNVRAGSDRFSGDLFVYVFDFNRIPKVGSLVKHLSRNTFVRELEALCARAKVPPVTTRDLRRIGLDLIHEACDGDPVTMKAAGQWQDLKTGTLHYFGPSIVLRGQESLIWANKVEERRLIHGIEVIGRPAGGDLLSATDGFRCRNPLAGPDAQDPGELCRARGMCPACPHARVDTADPVWSCAHLFALADHLLTRFKSGASPRWRARYRPALDALLELVLPLFPDDIVAQAALLPRIEIAELPDAQT